MIMTYIRAEAIGEETVMATSMNCSLDDGDEEEYADPDVTLILSHLRIIMDRTVQAYSTTCILSFDESGLSFIKDENFDHEERPR
jgi:hypothetical protein